MAKFCNKCGAQLEDSMVFCNKCGARQDVAPVQTPVTPNYTVGNSYNNYNSGATVKTAGGGSLSSSKVMRLIATALTVLAIILFIATPIVSSDQKMTGEVSYSDGYGYYGQNMNETNTETGKILEICDTSDLGGAGEAELKAYGIDISGFKTMRTIAIAVIIIAAIGAVALLLPVFTKTPFDSISGIIGIVAQVALAGGTAVIVFGMLAKEMESMVSKLLPIFLGDFQQTGISIDGLAIDVTATFSVWGWVFLCACAFAILTSVKAIQMSKADAN